MCLYMGMCNSRRGLKRAMCGWSSVLIDRLGSCRPLLTTNMLSPAVSDFNHTHVQVCRGLGWQRRHFADIYSACPLIAQQCLMARDKSRKTSWTLPLSFILYCGSNNRVQKNQLWAQQATITLLLEPLIESGAFQDGKPQSEARWKCDSSLYPGVIALTCGVAPHNS